MHFIFVYIIRGGFRTKKKCILKFQSKSENLQRSGAVRKFHAFERSGVPSIRKFSAYEIFWIYSTFHPATTHLNGGFQVQEVFLLLDQEEKFVEKKPMSIRWSQEVVLLFQWALVQSGKCSTSTQTDALINNNHTFFF